MTSRFMSASTSPSGSGRHPHPSACPSGLPSKEASRTRLAQQTLETTKAHRSDGRFQRVVSLEGLLSGGEQGRSSPGEITHSTRGNLQGAQFFAVAGAVYEAARAAGVGRELPTEWFLQDIRD